MEFKAMLKDLGVHNGVLTDEEKARLDHDGFVILHGIHSRDELAAMQAWIDDYIKAHGPATDEVGCDRLYHFLDKSPLFDMCWSHPRFLAAAYHILKTEFRPTTLNYRAALPGHGNQNLHSDQTWTAAGAHSYGQTIVALGDFTEKNGPTRLVAGSHRSRRTPEDEMKDTRERHPRQVEVIMPAGSVCFFNGCLWHSGTQNRSDKRRPALHCGFAVHHCDNAGVEGQRGTISKEMYNRLTPVLRNFLDFRVSATPPPTNVQFF